MNIDIIRMVAGGLLALVCCYIGIMIKRYYSERHKFYHEMMEFITMLSSELSFKKTPLPEVINRFCKARKGVLVKLLTDFMDARKKGWSLDKMIDEINIAHFKLKEKKLIIAFLYDLGKTSLDDQLANISRAQKEFDSFEKKSKEESKKLGGMYFKLAVLFGIALIILCA